MDIISDNIVTGDEHDHSYVTGTFWIRVISSGCTGQSIAEVIIAPYHIAMIETITDTIVKL